MDDSARKDLHSLLRKVDDDWPDYYELTILPAMDTVYALFSDSILYTYHRLFLVRGAPRS